MKDEIESWKWIHQQLTDQVHQEFELLGHRMNWMLASNAFLFTATAICLSANTSSNFYHLVPLLIGGAAALGIVISIFSHFSMQGAINIIRKRKKYREIYENKIRKEYGVDFNITVPLSSSHFIGDVPYYILPLSISIIWVIILYNILIHFV